LNLKETINQIDDHVNYYANLTPVMLNEIIAEEDYCASHILLKLIEKVRNIKTEDTVIVESEDETE
jgi:hypothetical protein